MQHASEQLVRRTYYVRILQKIPFTYHELPDLHILFAFYYPCSIMDSTKYIDSRACIRGPPTPVAVKLLAPSWTGSCVPLNKNRKVCRNQKCQKRHQDSCMKYMVFELALGHAEADVVRGAMRSGAEIGSVVVKANGDPITT